MAREKTLWPITQATQAKHTILRKYLDAWLPILCADRYAHDHLVLIGGFAGPGRYPGGGRLRAGASTFTQRPRCAEVNSEDVRKPSVL
jgi:three-Cys-motif partner protein